MSLGTPAPDSLGWIAGRIEDRIGRLLAGEQERWGHLDPDLSEPLACLSAMILAGGKRLRPAFCHWAYLGAGGGGDDEIIIDAGAALEMLHSFALIHDDIMDNSQRRHGAMAVHRVFEDHHARQAWRGESRRFGEGVGILIGNLAFVYADLLLAEAPPRAMAVFNELRLEVNLGQYLDLLGTVRGNTDQAAARLICLYKSGKYTVQRPLHLGAALAGRLDELGPVLSAYGLPLGEAFQLRDDLIGVFGDSKVTGKPVGEDLREGKPTVLFALAAEQASPSETKLLAEHFGASALSESEVSDMQAVLIATGAPAILEQRISVLLSQALTAINTADITAQASQELECLAYFVAGRDY